MLCGSKQRGSIYEGEGVKPFESEPIGLLQAVKRAEMTADKSTKECLFAKMETLEDEIIQHNTKIVQLPSTKWTTAPIVSVIMPQLADSIRMVVNANEEEKDEAGEMGGCSSNNENTVLILMN